MSNRKRWIYFENLRHGLVPASFTHGLPGRHIETKLPFGKYPTLGTTEVEAFLGFPLPFIFQISQYIFVTGDPAHNCCQFWQEQEESCLVQARLRYAEWWPAPT